MERLPSNFSNEWKESRSLSGSVWPVGYVCMYAYMYVCMYVCILLSLCEMYRGHCIRLPPPFISWSSECGKAPYIHYTPLQFNPPIPGSWKQLRHTTLLAQMTDSKLIHENGCMDRLREPEAYMAISIYVSTNTHTYIYMYILCIVLDCRSSGACLWRPEGGRERGRGNEAGVLGNKVEGHWVTKWNVNIKRTRISCTWFRWYVKSRLHCVTRGQGYWMTNCVISKNQENWF